MRKVADSNQVQKMESKMGKREGEAANLKGLLPHWGSQFVWQTYGLPVSSIRKDKQDRTAAAPDKRDMRRSVVRRQVDGRYLCDRRKVCEIAKTI